VSGAPTSIKAAETIRLIAIREITVRLRDKAFLVSTGVLLALVAGSVAIPLFLSRGEDRPEYTLAVSGSEASTVAELAKRSGEQGIAIADRRDDEQESGSLFEPGAALRTGEAVAPPVKLTVEPVNDVTEAERLVRDGTADAALVPASSGGGLNLVGDTDIEEDLSLLISVASSSEAATEVLTDAGVTPAQITQLQSVEPAQVRVDARALGGGDGDAELIADPIGQLLGFLDQRECLRLIAHLRMVDGQRREGAHLRPAVLAVARDLERAPPDRLRILEPVARPRHPSGEEQRTSDRPRLAESLGRGDRAREELFAGLEVGVDVDREVAAEP